MMYIPKDEDRFVMNNNKKYTVYKHTSPNGKIYIGCTSEKPEVRWKKGYHHNYELSEDIKNLGWDNFKHDIISFGLNEEAAYALERELIHAYNSNDPKCGYNKSIGGKINSGIIRSDEYRRKMSELKRGERHNFYGKHHKEETKRKISEANRGENHYMYGKHLSEETKIKLSDSHKKENLSEETLNKMRKARVGKKLNESTKKKIAEANCRKVKCIETKKIYDSVKQAAEDVDRNSTNITAACNGRLHTSAGYHWVYVND